MSKLLLQFIVHWDVYLNSVDYYFTGTTCHPNMLRNCNKSLDILDFYLLTPGCRTKHCIFTNSQTLLKISCLQQFAVLHHMGLSEYTSMEIESPSKSILTNEWLSKEVISFFLNCLQRWDELIGSLSFIDMHYIYWDFLSKFINQVLHVISSLAKGIKSNRIGPVYVSVCARSLLFNIISPLPDGGPFSVSRFQFLLVRVKG